MGYGGAYDDAAMRWKKGRLWLPAPQRVELLPTGATESPLTAPYSGGPAAGQISVDAANLTGVLMATADQVTFKVNIPNELHDANLAADLAVQLFFESGHNGAATGIDWLTAFKGVAHNQAFSDVFTSPDKLITWPAHTSVGQSKSDKTAAVGLGVPGAFAADDWLLIGVELDDDGDAAGDDIRLLGVALLYERSMTSATGVHETL